MQRRATSGVVVVILLLAGGTAYGQPGSGGSKAQVDLLSSIEAVTPGQPFDVAIRFQLTEDWHIYWQDSGDRGKPPEVDWVLPEGFTAGDLQFPTPKRHYAAGGVTTNILKYDPVLLVRIIPPQAIATRQVTLEAKVRYRVCKELPAGEQASLKLDLPVVVADEVGKPANKELFDRARAAMPARTSKYVTIAPAMSAKQLSPGKPFELRLTIDVAKRHHIQSHTPTLPSFIKCDVFMAPTDGLYFEDAVYPKPHLREVQYLGKLSEYSGHVVVRMPGEVAKDAAPGTVSVGGVFTYQACNDKGTCFPPDAIAFSLKGGATIQAGAGAKAGVAPGRQTGGALEGETGGRSTDALAQGEETPTPQTDEPAGAQGGGTVDEASAYAPELPGFLARFGLLGLLAACFIYGLVLNATPCVLPLLSIKVMGFVQHAHESRGRTMMLGLTFGLGVVLFFVVLGLLAAAGTNVLQYPAAVIGLGSVVLALALSMLGVYTLQAPTAATQLEASIQKEGPLSSFGKGALAPVLGFACTGPLLAGAWGWATQQPPRIAILAFLSAGLGMASPYVLLGANPGWLSFLPKPGNWMITFERIMGFLLLAMVIWLLHPIVAQMGPEGLECTLGFLVAIGMAAWVLGKIDLNMTTTQRWRYRGGAAAIALGAGVLTYGVVYPMTRPSYEIPWQPWSVEAVERSVGEGRTVLVDFTAAYCSTCKANKIRAFYTKEVLEKVQALGIVAYQGDWTSKDPKISAILKKYQRPGVPLNLIYPAGKLDEPIVLRPKVSKSYLLAKLDEAGPSIAGGDGPAAGSPQH